MMNVQTSDAVLFWTAADEVLASNKSDYVITRFKMRVTDDTKQFVCTANHSKDSYDVKVQLNLIS